MMRFWDAPHSRQITTLTPRHSIFTGRMLFLTPNQQCQALKALSGFWLFILCFCLRWDDNVVICELCLLRWYTAIVIITV